MDIPPPLGGTESGNRRLDLHGIAPSGQAAGLTGDMVAGEHLWTNPLNNGKQLRPKEYVNLNRLGSFGGYAGNPPNTFGSLVPTPKIHDHVSSSASLDSRDEALEGSHSLKGDPPLLTKMKLPMLKAWACITNTLLRCAERERERERERAAYWGVAGHL